jgi:hypothetical protein
MAVGAHRQNLKLWEGGELAEVRARDLFHFARHCQAFVEEKVIYLLEPFFIDPEPEGCSPTDAICIRIPHVLKDFSSIYFYI